MALTAMFGGLAAMKILFILATPLLTAPNLAVAAVLGAGAMMRFAARRRVFGDVSHLPHNAVGLVLGTSKFSGPRRLRNPHFDHRMAAAADLYRAQKVDHLLLSGDNGTRGYQEPQDMRLALSALGVPEDATTLDEAGYRTLDSVVRAREVFGLRQLTIITDRFHCFRAVFLARHQGLDAVAFPSQAVRTRTSWKSRAREYLADVLACLDVYVLRTRPRFVGAPVAIHVTKR